MLTRFRRLLMLALITTGMLVGVLSGIWSPASAQDSSDTDLSHGFVNIIEVSGYLDPVLVNFVTQQIETAERDGARGLVLQLNSPGALVDEKAFKKFADRIANATVPINIWVGPSGAKAKGRAGQLLGLADDVGIANGANFGDLGSPAVDESMFSPEFAAVYPRLRNDTMKFNDEGDDASFGFGRLTPTVILYLLDLPDFESSVDESGELPLRVPETQVRFGALSVFKQQVHNLGSPPVAYLLFLIGLSLLLFEFFTAGVGVAGIIGAGAFIGGSYGLDVLPARWWAVALLLLAILAFAVDIQTGVPRFWTVVGTLLLAIGSVFLYEGISLGWVALLTGLIGILVAMISGMPSMVRTRFSTPTIGRQWMLGQLGDVVEAIDPEGVVVIDSARWKARTNRATPVLVGDKARVVEIDGMVLEVEPEFGAARDYRERGPKSDSDERESDDAKST
ncbi:MAG: NfeD family protein [Acidimicrobiales bacterium]